MRSYQLHFKRKKSSSKAQGGVGGVSCAGPAAGIEDPGGSLPAQGIPWVYSMAVFQCAEFWRGSS